MPSKLLLSAIALVAGASAQSLTDVISNTPILSSLGSILEQYPDVAQQLAGASNITIFAPYNKAFDAAADDLAQLQQTDGAVEALLSYHVAEGVITSDQFGDTPLFPATLLTDEDYTTVTGGQVVVGTLPAQIPVIKTGFNAWSAVIQGDVEFDGGIVHVVDRVLTIPASVSATATQARLSALVGALSATDLVDTIDSASDVTIFAPSNAAFEAIGSAAADLSTDQLAEILQYHVIQGTVAYSTDITPGSIETLGGGEVTITVEDGAIFVNAARVIYPDQLVSGGVVHIIDSVLNPNNASAAPEPGSDAPVVQFQGASSAALGALTSGVPAPSASSYGALDSITASMTMSATGSAAPSSSGPVMATGAAPIQTAMVGAAALFGGAAVMANW